ncbi:unnamed protein product [Bathycoccus prasinos]
MNRSNLPSPNKAQKNFLKFSPFQRHSGWSLVTAGRLEKNLRALAHTLQTRCLDILLCSLPNGRTEQKPPMRRKDKATARSPAILNPLQSPRPASSGEKRLVASVAFMAKKVGKILSGHLDEDGCAVRFTVVTPMAEVKRNEFLVSNLKPGDIVAAPWRCEDESEVEKYYFGEVDGTEKKLSVTFFSDGESTDYSWDDQETTKILKVNDIKAGDLFKTCGSRVVGRRLFFRDTTDDPEKKYLSATVTGYDSETQQHQLQLHLDQPESPPSSDAMGPHISVDLSKADILLVRLRVTDVPAAATPETPPTMAMRATRTVSAARTDAQTPVHNNIAHTDNTNTSTERSAPTPLKVPSVRIRYMLRPSTSNYQLTSQVSFLTLAQKSLLRRSIRFPFSPDNDDVLLPPLDVLKTELAPKRRLRSSRSTDAKASETPVVDDVVQPPNRSSDKQIVKKKVKREG